MLDGMVVLTGVKHVLQLGIVDGFYFHAVDWWPDMVPLSIVLGLFVNAAPPIAMQVCWQFGKVLVEHLAMAAIAVCVAKPLAKPYLMMVEPVSDGMSTYERGLHLRRYVQHSRNLFSVNKAFMSFGCDAARVVMKSRSD